MFVPRRCEIRIKFRQFIENWRVEMREILWLTVLSLHSVAGETIAGRVLTVTTTEVETETARVVHSSGLRLSRDTV